MKLRAENLFEIVYAILGQIFLSEIDTISAFMHDLKQKFPTHSYLLDGHYVKGIDEGTAKMTERPWKRQQLAAAP